jgi:peptidoglycan/LPS O-acetylase OafA/YrhL
MGGGSIFIFPNLMPILVLFMAYACGPIKNNIVRYLGNISFEIYLLQGLAILVVESFGFPWHISVICVFALVIPLSEIAHRFSRLVASCL